MHCAFTHSRGHLAPTCSSTSSKNRALLAFWVNQGISDSFSLLLHYRRLRTTRFQSIKRQTLSFYSLILFAFAILYCRSSPLLVLFFFKFHSFLLQLQNACLILCYDFCLFGKYILSSYFFHNFVELSFWVFFSSLSFFKSAILNSFSDHGILCLWAWFLKNYYLWVMMCFYYFSCSL